MKRGRACFRVALPLAKLFLNAMTLDIAMGGSTNTVLHLLAVAHEAESTSKWTTLICFPAKAPCLCKVAPNTQKYHIQDVNRAGGIIAIMDELSPRRIGGYDCSPGRWNDVG